MTVFESARLLIRESAADEIDLIQSINEASDYIENWVGWKTPSNYALKTLTEGNLPPDGVREQFCPMTVYLRETGEAIGVLELYRGFPTEDTLLLGWLFVLPRYQHCGYAREAVEVIAGVAKKQGFSKIRIGVHLKNWPALRFWHAAGFDRVAGFIGDAVYSETTFASIILDKPLNEGGQYADTCTPPMV